MSTDKLVTLVANKFNCFGGGTVTFNNPLSMALKDRAPMFAAGVDVKEVVTFILAKSGRRRS